MIHGTPREANSLSPVPSAARPSRTARWMLFSFTCHLRLGLRVVQCSPRPHSPVAGISPRKLAPIVEECGRRSTPMVATAHSNRETPAQQARVSHFFHTPSDSYETKPPLSRPGQKKGL